MSSRDDQDDSEDRYYEDLHAYEEAMGPEIDRAEWQLERLQSYFLKNPLVVRTARDTLRKAEEVRAVHNEAALVFAISALEIGLKLAILRPLVYGLIHRRAAAELLFELEPRRDETVNIAFAIITDLFTGERGGESYIDRRRPGSEERLEPEIRRFQNLRNMVLHGGTTVSPAEADAACALARHVLFTIFESLLDQLELTIENDRIEPSKKPRSRGFRDFPKIYGPIEGEEGPDPDGDATRGR